MRAVFVTFAVVGITVVAIGGTVSSAIDAPGYQGPVSDHFDGERFHNLAPMAPKSFDSMLRWQLGRERAPWPEWIEAEPGPRPPQGVGLGDLRVTFVGHATLLVQVDGVNILTDPVYALRAGPWAWTGPERVRPPGIRFEDLPPIDAVLVSHDHYDHLDVPTLLRLVERDRPVIIAGLGTAALLAEAGIDGAVDLDWWQSRALPGGVRVTAVPVQHWSRRGFFDGFNTLWAGFVVDTSGGPVYFAGDTGWGPHFELTHQRFGPMRLAVLPVGSYLPRWFMGEAHVSPREAAEAHRVLGSRRSVAMHFGTFPLADDGPEQGPRELRAYIDSQDDFPGEVWVLGFGEGRDVPPLPGTPAADRTARAQTPPSREAPSP